jgi:hypothetical protein
LTSMTPLSEPPTTQMAPTSTESVIFSQSTVSDITSRMMTSTRHRRLTRSTTQRRLSNMTSHSSAQIRLPKGLYNKQMVLSPACMHLQCAP